MVVSQATNPNRAAAQKWSQTFQIHSIAFYGYKKSPYKILSKWVEKHGSYVNICSATVARKICPII